MARTSDRERSIEPITAKDLGAAIGDDRASGLRHESEKVGAKIDAAYQKLAKKLRNKADKAKATLETKKSKPKRALWQLRFELYANAAADIEQRLADRSGLQDGDDDSD